MKNEKAEIPVFFVAILVGLSVIQFLTTSFTRQFIPLSSEEWYMAAFVFFISVGAFYKFGYFVRKESTIFLLLGLEVLSMVYITGPGIFNSEGWVNSGAYLGVATVFLTGLYFLYWRKHIEKRYVLLLFLALAIIFTVYTFYFSLPYDIAKSSSPILNNNWFEALKWIENNTDECATVATYWDPGHFIRGIAKRTVVFDGASQNALLELPSNESDRIEIKEYDKGIVRIITYENGLKETARIQDIAATLLTNNESLALDILKNYRNPGCNEMYYLATSDLISKSTWWTYFATWSPTKKGSCPAVSEPKGDCYNYNIISLLSATAAENSIVYTYSIGPNRAFILTYDTAQDTFSSFLSENNNLFRVKSTSYFTRDGRNVMAVRNQSEIDGLVWIEPNRNTMVFIPSPLQDAIFTKLFFYNGEDLNNFELANQWGGEVKLFKVNFEEGL